MKITNNLTHAQTMDTGPFSRVGRGLGTRLKRLATRDCVTQYVISMARETNRIRLHGVLMSQQKNVQSYNRLAIFNMMSLSTQEVAIVPAAKLHPQVDCIHESICGVAECFHPHSDAQLVFYGGSNGS